MFVFLLVHHRCKSPCCISTIRRLGGFTAAHVADRKCIFLSALVAIFLSERGNDSNKSKAGNMKHRHMSCRAYYVFNDSSLMANLADGMEREVKRTVEIHYRQGKKKPREGVGSGWVKTTYKEQHWLAAARPRPFWAQRERGLAIYRDATVRSDLISRRPLQSRRL